MHKLEQSVAEFILEKQLLHKEERVLVAVSGGRDSMALLHVLNNMNFSLGIAHCNFGLRNEESNEDEAFVRNVAKQLNWPVWVKRFSAADFEQKGKSIQMIARELRYAWFDALAKKENFDKVVVAHHARDAIETLFINLTRGTGLRGLGMNPTRENKVVRPMLSAPGEWIDQYVLDKKIEFRDDASNASDTYLRNKLRHHVLPNLFALSEGTEKGILESIDILSETQEFINEQVAFLGKKYKSEEADKVIIKLSELKSMSSGEFVLYEWLRDYGFNKEMIRDMYGSQQNTESRIFLSDEYEAIVKSERIIVGKITERNEESYIFTKQIRELTTPVKLKISRLKRSHSNFFEKDVNIAYFDSDKLAENLIIRKWREGDSFMPLGMKGKKKLSDLFTDKKMNKFEKLQTWLIESNNKIVWVIGLQQDESSKVTEKTNQMIRIELVK